MKYIITLNDAQKNANKYDYVVRFDGTLATVRTPASEDQLEIMVYAEGEQPSTRHYFALFCLIMLSHKDITKPDVEGDITWDQITEGAKR